MKELVRRVVEYVPGYRSLDQYLRYRYTGSYYSEPYERGHYYSPLPDLDEIKSRESVLFRKDIDVGSSIDLRREQQRMLLTEFVQYYGDFHWLDNPAGSFRFHLGQGYFGYGDAVILHAILRHFKPKRVVEAGSGFSSALMLDTNERFLGGQTQFTFIEPFPERLFSLLHDEDRERCTIIRDKVENVPHTTFQQLQADDIFFVDSTHVAKIGGDVNFIFFDVLPMLNPGVLIHFHDILWPFEYPLNWILEGKAWNEAYMLRAFLQYNSRFEIVLFNSFVGYAFRSFMEINMARFLRDTGGSLWLRKTS